MTSSFRLTSQYFAAADKFKEYALSAYPVERVQAFYFDDVLGRSAGPSKRRVSGDTSVVSTITSSLQQTMQYILDDLRQSVDACSKREADATPNFKELLRIKGVWSSYRVLVEAHWGLHIRLGSLSDQVQAIGPPNLTQATELFEDVFFTTGSDQLSRLVSLQSELSRISVSILKTHGPQTLNQSELSGISVSRLPSLPGSTSVNTSCSKSNQKYDALTLLPLSPPPRSLSHSLPLSLSLSLSPSCEFRRTRCKQPRCSTCQFLSSTSPLEATLRGSQRRWRSRSKGGVAASLMLLFPLYSTPCLPGKLFL